MTSTNKSSTLVTISPSTILFTIGTLLAIYFLYQIQQILVTFFLALIVMSAINPMVRVLDHRLRIPKILSMLLIYAMLIMVLVTAFVLIIPPLVSEVPNFIHTLNLPPIPANILELEFDTVDFGQLFGQFQSSFSTIYSVISSTFSGIFTFFTILVMSSYLLLDRENLHRKIFWITNKKEDLALSKEFIDRVEVSLGGWVRGQLFLMLFIGAVTYFGLVLLNVPYALPLGLLAGLLEILPNLGPTLAAIPCVAIAYAAGGPGLALIVLIFNIIVQQAENNFIVPKIMKDNADVNPLTTILVILIGLKLGGVLGALLGVPIYIVLRTAYSMWLRERRSRLY